MILSNGILLTLEQSKRLAMVDSVDRDKLIAGIVAGMRIKVMGIDRSSRTFRERFSNGRRRKSRLVR